MSSRQCSWCYGNVSFGSCVTANVQVQTRNELQKGRIYFCHDAHANSWKRSLGNRLVKFDYIVPRINAEVRITGKGFSVTEVWPDGTRYVLRTRHGVSREAFLEELKKEGYGEITWLK